MVMQTGNCSTVELPGPPLGARGGIRTRICRVGSDNRHAPARSLAGRVAVVVCDPVAESNRRACASSPEITGPLRPATSGPGGSCTHDDLRTFTGATTPARSARADLLLRAQAPPPGARTCVTSVDAKALERQPPAAPAVDGSRTPARRPRSRVWPATRAAVMRCRPSRTYRTVAGTRQAHRRWLATLPRATSRYSSIFARSRPRPRRRISASGTHVVL